MDTRGARGAAVLTSDVLTGTSGKMCSTATCGSLRGQNTICAPDGRGSAVTRPGAEGNRDVHRLHRRALSFESDAAAGTRRAGRSKGIGLIGVGCCRPRTRCAAGTPAPCGRHGGLDTRGAGPGDPPRLLLDTDVHDQPVRKLTAA
jgi:hypothetical protein